MPRGYELRIGGEYDKQAEGFKNLTVVLSISVAAIYLALLFQFNNAIKPFLVFAAAPYGVAGALIALWIMNTSFGFMAFLGIASLIGVIVSHVIVLFDFIEEMHAKGEPFEQAVIDAGIIRLRPVLITVGCDGAGAVSAGHARRAAVAAAVLRADRRLDRSNVHHVVDGARVLLDHRARPEVADVGRTT